MQKCEVCEASWDAKRILDICPFCGANLRKKTTAGSIETIESAFKLILERHGQDVFKSGALLGLLGDYAPSLIKERKLVKVAIESGAYKAICESSAINRTHIMEKYVSILNETYYIDENWAKKVLMWCFEIFNPNAVTESNIAVKKEAEIVKEEDNSNNYEKLVISADSKVLNNNHSVITIDNILSLYRETIQKKAEGQGKYKEQIQNNYEYGVVKVGFEPITSNDFVFENGMNDGSIPAHFIPAIEKGIMESARHGTVAEFPVIGVKATLLGGLYHPITSTDNAFFEAAKKAFQDGITRAYPVVLEAIGLLKIDIPSEKIKAIKAIFDDINKRRGHVLGTESSDDKNNIIVKAEVPLPEMNDYSTFLSRISDTETRFHLEFVKYNRVSKDLVKQT